MLESIAATPNHVKNRLFINQHSSPSATMGGQKTNQPKKKNQKDEPFVLETKPMPEKVKSAYRVKDLGLQCAMQPGWCPPPRQATQHGPHDSRDVLEAPLIVRWRSPAPNPQDHTTSGLYIEE